MYDADGMADAVTFKLSPAIRGPDYTGRGFSCVDEVSCDEEEMFLCAQETQGAGVHFLACMDDTRGGAEKKGQTCAQAESMDYSAITACYHNDQGTKLKSDAALYFDAKFPESMGIPRVEINGQEERGVPDYNRIISDLCATGISAGACSSAVTV